MPSVHPPIIPYRDLSMAVRILGQFVPPNGVQWALIVRPFKAGANISVRLHTLGGGVTFELNTMPTGRTLAALKDEAAKLLDADPGLVLDFTGIGRDQ